MTEAERYVFAGGPPPLDDPHAAAIAAHHLADEMRLVAQLRIETAAVPEALAAVRARALSWVHAIRADPRAESVFDALLREYALSSGEGVVLMALAESLLRIPDAATAQRLIGDRLGAADWDAHLGGSESLWVNASAWALALGGRVVATARDGIEPRATAVTRLFARLGEPVVRAALSAAMRRMGAHFVVGRDIGEALQHAEATGLAHSFDMLGEAAMSADDAQRYLHAYREAIVAVSSAAGAGVLRHGVSVKLSALHPRYGYAQRERVLDELIPRLRLLAHAARDGRIALTVDAEECERLELSLEVFSAVCADAELADWDGLGLAVQAYQKRAVFVIDALAALAHRVGRRLPVRLVKGAYWDSEIKRAQEQGLPRYPVFTHKLHTDLSFLSCAQRLFDHGKVFYPMFATHNAQTIAAVLALAARRPAADYEFQRLHGMGEALHARAGAESGVACRVYAPVGAHAELLPYLVRRLLENGANTSFVHHLHDARLDAETLVVDPRTAVEPSAPALPAPDLLYAPARKNSQGLPLSDAATLATLAGQLAVAPRVTVAQSLVVAAQRELPWQQILDPADHSRVVGRWQALDLASVDTVVQAARAAQAAWNAAGVSLRAAMLERAADAIETDRAGLLRLLIRESGKTLADGLAELRETVDLLRYYAVQARGLLGAPQILPGPTGEHNELQLHGRGVFACIAPWNFPLSIFTGQLAAALVAGNAVIAKPAEQTPLIAHALVARLHAAGVPREVLQLALGDGAVGAALCAHEALSGVAFTGSFDVAQAIARQLAARAAPLATLIAETGGLNAMLVDSSALPEQVVRDVIPSAFLSAGQRCSSLRVLFLQHEIAAPVLRLLRGAMQELLVGDPGLIATDIGPLIDADAKTRLVAHIGRMRDTARLIAETPLSAEQAERGHFLAPIAFEIDAMTRIGGEHFGPVLHVIRYAADELDAVIEQINASGYGLTLGVQSRIESTWRHVQARARVGNCYVNRGITGAVVGTQPFGGEGWSGTGPKAGGPHYLLRFVTERCLSVNTAAVGGNLALLVAPD